MDEKIIVWTWQKREEGLSEDQIRRSLEESGWNGADIVTIMAAPKPQAKPQGHQNMIKILYVAIAAFIVLLTLMALVGFGVLSDDKIKFTHDKCLSLNIPKSACDSLQAIVDDQPLEDWLEPSTLANLDAKSKANGVFPENADLFVDLNTWTPSEVVNVESANICVANNEQLYLVLMSASSGKWLVDVTFQLDDEGTNAITGSVSYCKSHL